MPKKSLAQFQHDIAVIFQRGMYKGSKKEASGKFRNEHTFSRETTKNYASIARDFANFVYDKYGISDLSFLKAIHGQAFIERAIERFQSGELAAGSPKTYTHALDKLQNMARAQTGSRIRVINKDAMLARAKEVGAVRRFEDGHKGRIITWAEAGQMVEILAETRSPNHTVFSELARFGMETGARPSSALRLQVRDINVARNAVEFNGDKGGKSRIVMELNPDYVRSLAKMIEGKAPGRQVFEVHRRDGNLHKIEDARRIAENLYARHAEKVGLAGANYQSQRKAFANFRYNQYQQTNYKALERDLAQRMKDSPQLARKMDRLENESGARHGAGRHYSHTQLAKILVSIDLGHERLDVLRFYLAPEGGA